MATNNTVSFTINLNGNAYNGVVQLGNAVNQTLNPAIRESQNLFHKIGDACFRLNNIFDMVGRTVGRVAGKLSEFEQAGRAQAEAETKLAQVMRNTMGDDIVRRYGNVEAALNRQRKTVENLSLSFKELPGKVEVPVGLKPEVTGEKEMLKTFDRVRGLADKAPKGVDMGFDLRPVVRGEEEVVNAMDRIRSLGKPLDVKVPVEIQPAVVGADAFETAMERIRKLTADQQRKGVIGDEIQIAGAQELARNVTQLSTLEKLIPVMNDLTAQQQGYNATQEGAVGNARMLGRALQGNIMLLERSGYQFTEAQKRVMKTGDEAQKTAVLAEVLSQKVGGVNEALANTPEGRVVQLNNAYGDLQERLGGLWANLKDSLFPVFDGLIQRADGLIDVIEEKIGAAKEWIAGAVAWLSGVWGSVKEPVMNTVTSLWGSLRSIVGNIVNSIAGIVRNHSTVIRGIVAAIGWSIRTVGNVLAWVSGLVTGFVNFLSGAAPIVLGFAGAYGILTLATKAQAIEQSILNGATMLGVGIGKLLGGTIAFVNAAMAANPVYWVIAGIIALAGVITFLAIKVKGWGTLWGAVVEFAKHSFLAYVETVKLQWTAMINSLMIGLDKIKEAWYKFRKAVGIGDENENDTALAKIAQDVKAVTLLLLSVIRP